MSTRSNVRPPSPRRRHDAGVHARKSLGQHFLVDREALTRIVAAAELRAGDAVLEIGAGTGLLTAALREAGASVAAVEIDEALCTRLRRRFADDDAVRVVCASILDHTPEALLAQAGLGPPYTVVANIPYFITAPILRILLECEQPPERIVLTVQREVAETIAAPPGAMSLLSVSVQYYARAQVLFTIPARAFRPPPKVDSAVVRLDRLPAPAVSVGDRAAFFALVRAGFRRPRKQLHNSLSEGLWLPPGEALRLLSAAGINEHRRAQTLSLDEWARLSDCYELRRENWQQPAVLDSTGEPAPTNGPERGR